MSTLVQDLEKLEKKVVDAAKEVAEFAFEEINWKSPAPGTAPFSEGPFILSNKLGVNFVDTNIDYSEDDPNPSETSLKKAKHALTRKMKLGDFISISNSIEHANDVEFKGWEKTPPYAPYGKTWPLARIKAEQVVRAI